ncbi:protein AKNAD1 isoform X6 [Canis lupus baileyi]|uniref:protein AKNAD1 isoform X9 n=1 Tax=Canis lupus familiaris TaxID=9615 RepID=UPI0003AE0E43|nr:protein AKNAD1 isoform X9 [Canis lupus familiaris]XP_025273191.1 protein AKNAD1 isoform X5 [Canis lupus dingo]XP_038525861.1 protein AKNAD1 isoform X9 [Canis lupus familiaris]|eukprot:XP_005621897.1 protein AKNAD1 isoform X5 [Canis lupus familiaris]
MDKANFSEATTSKQPEDLPYDGDFSQTKIYNDYNFTSKNDILDVLNQISLTVDDPQGKATYKGTCRNADITMTLGKMTKSVINKNYDTEKQSTTNLDILTNERDPSKSNISDILLHHLSNEEFLKGQGINCETLPEIADADSSDEAIIKNIILCHVKNSWPKEQTPELTDQLSPKRDGEHSNVPCCSLTMTEENTSDIQAAGESSHQETLNFLTKIRSPHDKPKSCQGQPPQKLQTEKAVSGNVFKHGHGQVHYQLSDFSKVAPKVKTPKNNIINKPLTTDKQASFSPKLRDKSVIVQVILESMSRSNCIEKQEQKRKSAESSQQVEMEPTIHIHQEYLTGIESEASLFKVSSTSQKDPSPSSSYIFQKITRGKQMCQKLKEQTDQLKIKVQEFSKSIAQDVPYHLQDKKLVLEKLQGHLELLEQEFLDNKEKHLTLKQVHRHESPAVGDFDPEREVEGEIFKLEMLLEDVKEKINKGKCTSAVSLPVSSPIIPDDLASTTSPPSNEEGKHGEERAQKDQQQKVSHCHSRRGAACRFCCSDTSPSCHSASRTGLQSNKCENYGTENHNSRRVCRKEPLKEFHYRYNSPGQNYLNPNERSAFVKLCFLNDNKNSSPSCSKPEWICSQTSNPKSSHDEHETIPGKKNLRVFMTYNSDLATPSLHFYSCRISGSKSLRNFGSTKETKSEILNSSLDHALRTATILKETTDRMIRIIAEDLAKAQRWRKQMKY